MNYLQNLIGKRITEILFGEGEYYALETDKSDTNSEPHVVQEIVIKMQDYSLRISNTITLDEQSKSIKDLLGEIIVNALETEQEIKITTTGNKFFQIDLRNEAYKGPEALSLYGPDNLCMVWN